MSSVLELIQEGQAALDHTDWDVAKKAFEAALRMQDVPEAQDGLGIALWWLNDVSASHRHRTRAYIAYKNQGDVRHAALIAAWLAREQVFLSANIGAMQGWFARAERLLSETPPSVEHGWFALWRASLTAPSAQLEQITADTLA